MVVSVSIPNGLSVSSSSSTNNGTNTVLQKMVSMFRITVSSLLARNYKYQNFKNPTLELTWSSRLSYVFFFLLCACCFNGHGMIKKKKDTLMDLITCFTCPIFTAFGNKDNCILHVFSCFFTCGTHRTHLQCGSMVSCHIHGVKTLVWI